MAPEFVFQTLFYFKTFLSCVYVLLPERVLKSIVSLAVRNFYRVPPQRFFQFIKSIRCLCINVKRFQNSLWVLVNEFFEHVRVHTVRLSYCMTPSIFDNYYERCMPNTYYVNFAALTLRYMINCCIMCAGSVVLNMAVVNDKLSNICLFTPARLV